MKKHQTKKYDLSGSELLVILEMIVWQKYSSFTSMMSKIYSWVSNQWMSFNSISLWTHLENEERLILRLILIEMICFLDLISFLSSIAINFLIIASIFWYFHVVCYFNVDRVYVSELVFILKISQKIG
jgi:hypothetical protein